MRKEMETQSMTQFNFVISRDELRAFKMRAASEGKIMAEILRESVRNYIQPAQESQGNSG